MTFRVYVVKPQRDRDGNNWQMVGKPPKGSGARTLYRTSGTADRAEAEARAREWERIINGLAAPLRSGATLRDVMDKHLAHRETDGTEPGTVTTYRTAFRRLEPLLGDVAVSELSGPALARARNALADRLDGKTVNVTMSRLRCAWRWAIELGHVADPWPEIRGAKASRTKKRPMRPKELAAFLTWAASYRKGKRSRPPWEGMYSLLADTGARSGDACSRDGRHLDRANRRVWIYDAKLKMERWSGLTARTVALLPEVGPNEPLFAGQRGRLTTHAVLRVFRAGVKSLGLEDGERLDVHSLRRTNAKEADRTGVSIGMAAKQQGHRSLATQMRYQLDPDDDENMAAVADQIASRWTPLLDPPADPPTGAPQVEPGADDQWFMPDSGKTTERTAALQVSLPPPSRRSARKRKELRSGAPDASGGCDPLMLVDPYAKSFAHFWDYDPEAVVALLFTAWRLRRLSAAASDERPDLVAKVLRAEAEPAQKAKRKRGRA